MSGAILFRLADPADAAALREMQALSFRVLGAMVYAPEVIEAFIAEVGTLDDHLLHDGRYRVASLNGVFVGCGGWSTRSAGYDEIASGGAVSAAGAPVVRAVYVHPTWARHGIARRLMAEAEADMAACGFETAELASTLSGLPFYRRLGYREGDTVALRLGGELELKVVEMQKRLPACRATAA